MLLALSIVGLFVLPDPWRVILVVVAALIEVFEVWFWIHFLRRYRVQTGAEAMVGERAEVIGPGRVRLRGEIWTARGPTDGAKTVRVKAVDGLTLEVEPDPGQ
jgi:membrane protein implicated in regulation of membrane protease activity